MKEINELNNLLSKYVDQGFFPGVQWQINIEDDVYAGKYGLNNIDTKQEVFDNSIYRIWSMTKPIVAIAALKLVEEKKITLDDPITEYLPEFNGLQVMAREDGNVEDVETIIQYPTIRDLFLHTAGFSYNFLADPVGKQYDQLRLFNSDTTTLEEEIKILAKAPLLFQPQTSWRYSVSMDVLARIVEIVRGNSLQSVLQREIFEPLNMSDTAFAVSSENQYKVMASYEYDPVKNKLSELISDPQKIGNYGYPLNISSYARGGHGLFSTLNDYAAFARMLHTGKSDDGYQILNADTLKLISTNFLEEKYFPIEIATIGIVKDENYVNGLEAYGWGLGCRTLLDPSKQHNLGSVGEFGWAGAASTYFLVDNSKKLSATIMTQVLFGNPDLHRDF
ncbi:MAG: serine hydrolase domain-containing protein, partial [Candidatus Kariarchaeum pelagius]